MEIERIGVIHTDFKEKFGIPRQSGLVKELTGTIVFEKQYRTMDCLRGIEQFSHLWLIWEFSEVAANKQALTVRPPRLGGNTRLGVFATRSPFRPNRLGLTVVRLEKVTWEEGVGPVLLVSGVDLLDGTPIYDIKPYLPYADIRTEAEGGFAEAAAGRRLEVVFPEEELKKVPPEKREALIGVLEQDPRPAYQDDPNREYGMSFADCTVRFCVQHQTLSVVSVNV